MQTHIVGYFCIKVFNIFTDFLNSRRGCGGRVFFVLILRYPSTHGGVFFVLRYLYIYRFSKADVADE